MLRIVAKAKCSVLPTLGHFAVLLALYLYFYGKPESGRVEAGCRLASPLSDYEGRVVLV